MAFLVGGANTLTAGYDIDNSLRFNSGDSADLRITPGSAGTEETFTISAWIKKSMSDVEDAYIFSSQADASNRTVMGIFGSASTQGIFFENRISTNSSYTASTATYRDPSAWMHCVWAIDTTQGTDTNRVKLYVNGNLITDILSGESWQGYPDQNIVTHWSRAQVNYVGSRAGGNYFGGYMAEVYYIDGSQLTPASFGETDEDSGIWKPKQYSGSFGGESWFLEFKETGTGTASSSTIGADTSGEDNHITSTNLAATDQTTDSPTNNFMTLNPLITNQLGAFSEGNTQIITAVAGSAPYGQTAFGNFAVNTGKWYFEAQVSTVGSGGQAGIGFNERIEAGAYVNGHNNLGSGGNVAYTSGGALFIGSTSETSTGVDSFTDDDTISIAFDLDNNKVYVYKNGALQDGNDPASNDGRGIVSAYNNYWTPWVTKDDTNNNVTAKFNFGNPSQAISSGNADANGYGNFEYAVPSGYFALCTKNLAEHG